MIMTVKTKITTKIRSINQYFQVTKSIQHVIKSDFSVLLLHQKIWKRSCLTFSKSGSTISWPSQTGIKKSIWYVCLKSRHAMVSQFISVRSSHWSRSLFGFNFPVSFIYWFKLFFLHYSMQNAWNLEFGGRE